MFVFLASVSSLPNPSTEKDHELIEELAKCRPQQDNALIELSLQATLDTSDFQCCPQTVRQRKLIGHDKSNFFILNS